MGTSQTSPDRHPDHLLVRSGGQRCAIPLDATPQVTGVLPVAPLPRSAPRLLGLAQFAGEPVAVVDLHGLLDPAGLAGGGYRLTVILRHRNGAAPLGLAVDDALGMVSVERDEDRRPDDPPWVAGRGRAAGQPAVLLDPARLFEPVP